MNLGFDSSEIFVLAIVAMSCLTAVTIIFLLLIFATLTRRRGRRTRLTDEEVQSLEDIWSGLQKMENRMANLETILLERRRGRDPERRP